MTRRRDKVQKSMYSIISEARITLDTGFFCKDVVVLTFKVANNLLKTMRQCEKNSWEYAEATIRKLIVNVVTKAWGVDNGQSNTNTILFEFYVVILGATTTTATCDGVYSPTLTGLMRIPSSTWAVSGESEILCAKTSDSQSVLTKVVRPVPEEPGEYINDAKSWERR